MSYSDDTTDAGGWRGLLREERRRRGIGLAAALAIEALLVLLLLTLSQSKDPPQPQGTTVTTFDASPEQEAAPDPPSEERQDPAARPSPAPRQEAEPIPQPPQPVPPPAAVLPRRELPRDFDLAQLPKAPTRPAPAQPAYGPQGSSGFPGDSERVGTAPDGSPLYAAEWYRRPSQKMLGDYLSTTRGPGWGLIACRTVPDWRVEDCVAVGEYPQGSGIARAVLAAAWEFQVRPPRLRGQHVYGAWVRIRIDYEIRGP